MNTIDIVLLGIACALVIVGMWKGLVRVLVGVAALVAAFALAARYHAPLAERLGGVDLSDGWLPILAYLLIFVGVMLAGGLIAFLIRRVLKAAMLGWLDRLAGGALGLLAAAVLAGVLVLPLVAYMPNSSGVLRGSVLAPYAVVVGDLATSLAPSGLSDRYRENVKDLRREWQRQDDQRDAI
ncbi:MAG: CvpA family protein [Acidobacteriota bacterium]|nr:CvpA family protein [Acidobacteriota bacterium]MDH3783932.1 CvpA family protein [Acidobacteriota bacterium]